MYTYFINFGPILVNISKMDSDNIVLDEETILNNIKNMYNGNWEDILDYYNEVTKWWRFYFSVCDKAAYNGHLEVLKYAHENGCSWDERTCRNAAWMGELEILYYLYENEAPYCTIWGIHPDCKEFFDTFGEYWKKGDYTLNHRHLKPAKN